MEQIEDVLLIHGLAGTSVQMTAIGIFLSAHGYRIHGIDYPSTTDNIENLTNAYLKAAFKAHALKRKIHIVTHSMGGIMVRQYLKDHAIPNLGRIVMIAPGNAGSALMTMVTRNPLAVALVGPAGLQSTDDQNCYACKLPRKLEADYGIIAGNMPLDPLGWLTMNTPNDGKITIDSTKMDDMRDHVVIPASHETLLFHPMTMAYTHQFLKHGQFRRA